MTSTALVTDSTALLPPELVERTGAVVVPVTVTVDGVDHLDGVDLDADDFYRRLDADPPSEVSTAQPSPARFLDAYERAAATGAAEIVAVLVGSAFSGTVDSARLAAAQAPIPVTCVDTGQASFGVGLCALAAAEALDRGTPAAEIERIVVDLAGTIRSVFVIQARELALASGRFGDGELLSPSETSAIPVLHFGRGELSTVAEVRTLDDAVAAMAAEVLDAGGPIRVGSGLADPATRPVTEALERRLEGADVVRELIRYRVGPSVAASTGPGTAGVFWHPLAPG